MNGSADESAQSAETHNLQAKANISEAAQPLSQCGSGATMGDDRRRLGRCWLEQVGSFWRMRWCLLQGDGGRGRCYLAALWGLSLW